MDGHTLPHDHRQAMEQELTSIPSPERFQTAADVFKQLGDGSRIRIFWLLCHCEECVVNISAMVSMSSPAVSHHLRQLKAAGLIVSRREGKEVYYRAADTEESRLLHQIIEQVLDLTCPELLRSPGTAEPAGCRPPAECQSELEEIVHAIHDRLTRNIGQRITIEELSRQYAVNPTTLKTAFKSVYGNSLAAHIKEHRMELAARLLRETDASIAEIGQQVGYESQGKFTAAFKSHYQLLPKEYRKMQRQ